MVKAALIWLEYLDICEVVEFASKKEVAAYAQGVSDMSGIPQHDGFSVVTLEDLEDEYEVPHEDFREEVRKALTAPGEV